VAELETKVLAADPEEAPLTLSLDEADVVLAVSIRLLKVEIVASK